MGAELVEEVTTEAAGSHADAVKKPERIFTATASKSSEAVVPEN